MQTDWIAVDWGTSHLRVWAMDPTGRALAALSSDKGMGTLEADQFEPALLALINPYLSAGQTTKVICCGMAGAAQGWSEAAYAPCPCPPPGLARAKRVQTADPRLDVYILPGVSQATPPDVMRGEETQIAGFLHHSPGFDGVICLPGTHSKWAQISAGEIVSFATYMTGELFALLSTGSVLRHSLSGGWDSKAFLTALDDAMSRPQAIAGRLFGIRAQSLLSGQSGDTARARLSGLLIGLELAAARPYWLGQNITLIGSDTLAARYGEALSAQGATPVMHDAETITLDGLRAAYSQMNEVET